MKFLFFIFAIGVFVMGFALGYDFGRERAYKDLGWQTATTY